jgi:hypothetical protein
MFRLGNGSVFSNDCLWKHHLFAERDPRFVELLSRDVQVEVFRPGELIVKEAAKGNSMYILRRGQVEVLAGGVTVARLGSGSVFGEIMLLGVADRRTATVRASEFSDCRVVHRKAMQRLLRLFPREKEYFEKLARRRLADLKAQAAAAALHNPRRTLPTTPSIGPGGLPLLEDEGFAERSEEYASVMSTFSRFFEKQSFPTGKLKKSSPPSIAIQAVNHLVELEKYRPRLPPLIVRRGESSSGELRRGYEDKDDEDLPNGVPVLPAAKGAVPAGGSALSPRSPSPRSSSPKPRFFMYGKTPGGKPRRLASPTASAPISPTNKLSGGDVAHSARSAKKDAPEEAPDLA